MDKTQERLLALLAAKLFGRPCDAAVNEAVITEAKKQAVLATVDQRQAMNVLAQNMRVLHAHGALDQLLAEHGIPCVIIKGWASAFYYPRPELRHLGDVDFLIPLEEREHASRVLQENGYTLTEDTNPHHWGYRKGGIEHELHWRLNGAPEGKLGEQIAEYMADVWEQAQTVNTGAGSFQIPSDFHNGLIMILHMARHMTSSGMGLRHLCDWAVFVDRVPDFEGSFRACFEELGLWHFACLLTGLCSQYLGLEEQPWAQNADSSEVLEDMILDIMGAGNFGRKKETGYEHVLLGDLNADGGTNKHGKLYNLIRKLNQLAGTYVPVTRRCPLLLPLGWVYVTVQYLVRVLQGKRKLLNPVKMVTEADRRAELYQEFRLFEK